MCDFLKEMRNLTKEEEDACSKTLERISVPTGIVLFEENKEDQK